MKRSLLLLSTVALLIPVAVQAAEWGLKPGTPQLKSAGALAFGPDGILLVGDTKAATIYAIATDDAKGQVGKVDHAIDGVVSKIAGAIKAKTVKINDMAVNPESGTIYLSVSADDSPAIVKMSVDGTFSKMDMANVKYLKAELSNAPNDAPTGRRRRNPRDSSITDLAYVDGRVIVSGLSAADSPSTIRELDFPFKATDRGASVEIFHGAHGKYEDYAPVQTFVPFNIGGEPNLLAGYICTPLVKFPLASLKSKETVRGTTVAELGNRNRPLDMIVYKKDGKDYLLLTNSARGVMKISTENIARNEGITKRVEGGGTAGQEYETVDSLQNVVQLDKLDDTRAAIITETDGAATLKIVALP